MSGVSVASGSQEGAPVTSSSKTARWERTASVPLNLPESVELREFKCSTLEFHRNPCFISVQAHSRAP